MAGESCKTCSGDIFLQVTCLAKTEVVNIMRNCLDVMEENPVMLVCDLDVGIGKKEEKIL